MTSLAASASFQDVAVPPRPGLPTPSRGAIGRPAGLVLDAARLRARRQDLGLSQEVLAARAGLASRTLQNAEYGQRVSLEVARAIAGALGLALEELAEPHRAPGAHPAHPTEIAERLIAGGFAPPPTIGPIGREAELADLMSAFEAGSGLCIVGPPGIGKSALAAHLVEALSPHGPVCWLDAARVERHDPSTAMLALARCLGFSERLPNPNLVPLDALARAFRKAFWARSPTLVLDDATSPAILGLFHDAGAGRLLVTTSSRSLAAALALPRHELGPLSTEDALALLTASLGAPLPPCELPAAHELIALIGRSPRALALAARDIAREPFTRLHDHVERLRATLGQALTVPGQPGPSSFATWLGLGERLPQAALDALGALAIFERRRVPLAWALAAIGGEQPEARALLSRLYDLHLFTRLGPDAVGLDADSQRVARSLPAGPALERLVDFALPRLAEGPPLDELPLYELLVDALANLADLADLAEAPLSPGAEQRARLARLVELAHPLAPTLMREPSPVTGHRLLAALHAALALAQGRPSHAARDLAGALGVWLTTLAGHHAAARSWLEVAIQQSLALGDPTSAARFAAQRAPTGYYLGDPVQGIDDISRAIDFALAAGDRAGADASIVMRALGRAHMFDAWDEAIADLELVADGAGDGELTTALARVDLAVCELTLGRAPSRPEALVAAFDTLLAAASESPLDHAGLSALAVLLGVHPRPGLDPSELATSLLEAIAPQDLRDAFLRMDILAQAFLSQRAPCADTPAFAVRRGTVVLPLLPSVEVGHHLALILPLQPFEFLLAPPVLAAALTLVDEHLGEDHPLHAKLTRLSALA